MLYTYIFCRHLNVYVTIFVLISVKSVAEDTITVPNIKLRFPPGISTMGIFVALAFPIDLPNRDVYYSHFFEAIHILPSNQTSFEYPPLISERNMDRKMIYKALEKKIKSKGYPGKSCLLRTICEISQYSIKEINGLLGEIIHIIFTPSTTLNSGISADYTSAEERGRKDDCSLYNKKCSISIVDLISKMEDTLEE